MAMFGGTIKLQGATEYQQALNKITSNLKVMNSEMKVVTSTYDKNHATSKDLIETNEVLNKKLDMQKQTVSNLEKVLEQAKVQYGEDSTQVKKLTIELNNATADVNKTKKAIDENNDTLKDMKKAHVENVEELKKFEKESDNAADHSKNFSDVLKANLLGNAIRDGLSKIVDGIKQIGSALKDQISEMAEYGDSIDKNSQKVGFSAEAYQEWDHVMQLNGTGFENCTAGIKTLTTNVGNALEGSQSAIDKFTALGISVDDLKGKSSEDIFAMVISSLQGVEDGTQKAIYANDLLGKSGQNLMPLLNQTADATQDQIQAYRDMGGVLSNDAVKASASYEDSLTNLKGALNGITQAVGTDVLPELTDFINNTVIPYIKDTLVPMIQENLPAIKQKLKEVWDVVKEAGQFVVDNGDTIIAVASGVGAALVAMKVGEFVSGIVGFIGTIKEAAVAQGIFNAVLSANPIGIVALAIGGLVTAGVLLYQNWDTVTAGAQALWSNIQQIFSNICGWIVEKFNEIISFFSGLPATLAELGNSMFTAMGEGISNAASFIYNSVVNLASNIISNLKNGLASVVNVGKNIVTGIWNGISGAKDWLMSKIKGFADGVVGGIKDFFGIHSPSRVMRDQIGNNLALGIGEGFEDTMETVNRRMSNAVNVSLDSPTLSMRGIASGSNGDLVSAFKEAMSGMHIVLDDEVAGAFVERTVTKAVYGV